MLNDYLKFPPSDQERCSIYCKVKKARSRKICSVSTHVKKKCVYSYHIDNIGLVSKFIQVSLLTSCGKKIKRTFWPTQYMEEYT